MFKFILGMLVGILVFLLFLAITGTWIIRKAHNNFFAKSLYDCRHLQPVEWNYESEIPTDQFLLETTINCTKLTCYNLEINMKKPKKYKVHQVFSIEPISKKRYLMALILYNDKSFIISCVGTSYFTEWLDDLDYKQVQTNDGNIHRGFLRVWEFMAPDVHRSIKKLYKNQQMYVTGISLGGALATLCAKTLSKFRPYVITFASPRVGNETFKTFYELALPDAKRVFNANDLVPMLPLVDMGHDTFIHVGIPIGFELDLGSVLNNHILSYVLVDPAQYT